MMQKLQTLICYAIVLVVLVVLYYIATSFAVAIVDEKFTRMEPTLESGGTYFLDRRSSTVTSLSRDDLIAYKIMHKQKTKRMFGRVLALPGATVRVSDKKLLVNGDETANAPRSISTLKTGLLVPRDTVLVGFDSQKRGRISLSQRLVPYRSIIGRVIGK